MTATAEQAQTEESGARPISLNPYFGILGVFLGAATSTLNAKLIGTGLADLRGALGYGFDDASWIPTALNMGMRFSGHRWLHSAESLAYMAAMCGFEAIATSLYLIHI